MTNVMFNPAVKELFLSTYLNQDTQTTYRYIFYRSEQTESKLGKDLYQLDLDELSQVFKQMKPTTENAARSYGRIVTAYMKWAMSRELVQGSHPLQAITQNWFDQFVNKDVKLYLSEAELKQFVEKCLNAQDAVIPMLIFEGVSGFQGSEILNLRKQDIDFDTRTLKVRDDRKGEREVVVSEYCLRLIRQALQESVYQKKNGESEAKNPEVAVVQNDYVVRAIVTRVKNMDRADKHTIYRRLSMLGESFDLPHLTLKNIEKSGMIKMGRDLWLRDQRLETVQLKEIAERFNLSKVKMGNYEAYNFSTIKHFVNLETIFELYPEGDRIFTLRTIDSLKIDE